MTLCPLGQPTAEMVAQAKKLALEEYKKDHPDFAKKLDQVHIDWMKTHDGIPTTVSEKKKYTNLIKVRRAHTNEERCECGKLERGCG